MLRLPRVASLLCGLGAASAVPPPCGRVCRFASRGAGMGASPAAHRTPRNRAARRGDDACDEDHDLEDVGDQLQALMDAERKRQKVVKYNILKRKMTPPGAPERRLTWEAIQQIRYLKQEQPEEWTVERLAEGFCVTPDDIRRVLRSKFVPAPDRKAKQDTKAMAGLNQQLLSTGAMTARGMLRLAGEQPRAALAPGSAAGGLVPVAEQAPAIAGESAASPDKRSLPVIALPSQATAGAGRDATATVGSSDRDGAAIQTPTQEGGMDEESWDGQVLSEEELEELMDVREPAPPLQVVKDFFDAEGNFLYRI